MIGFSKFVITLGLVLALTSAASSAWALYSDSLGFVEMAGDTALAQQAKDKILFLRNHVPEKVGEILVCFALGILGWAMTGEDRTPKTFQILLAVSATLWIVLVVLQSWFPVGLYFVGFSFLCLGHRHQLPFPQHSLAP